MPRRGRDGPCTPPAAGPALPTHPPARLLPQHCQLWCHLVTGPGGHWRRRTRAEGPRVCVEFDGPGSLSPVLPRPPPPPSGAAGLTNALFCLAFSAVNERKSHTSKNKSGHFFSHFCEVARQTGHCFFSTLISALARCESLEPRGDLGRHSVGAGRVRLCASD